MMSFPYRTAVVTGASSGIGRSFAHLLAQRGVDLMIAARRGERLDQLARELIAAHRIRVEPVRCDLRDDQDLSNLEDRLGDPAHPVDLLVSNAGFGTTGLFHSLPADRELDQLMVNVVAPLRLARAALPGMVGRGRGGVICVSSMVGALPMPRSATYGATKAFLSAFHESLHVELRGRGVTVTTVNAGLTRTGFHEAAGADLAGIPAMAWLDPDQVALAGLRGWLAGRPIVVPGAMNRAQIPLLRLAPRAVLRSLVRRMWKV
jgi:short-subunit dehydrogenase